MPNQKNHTEWQRNYRHQKIINKECLDCKLSVVKNKSRCQYHLRIMALNVALWRERHESISK